LKLREVAKVPISANAYSLYIRQRQEANAQVFSLDYGDKLRVYDVQGTLRSSRNWSSKVRCIAVADVEGEGDDALVGGVGKRVLVVDHRGRPMWKIELESTVVACDARDVDGDDAAEVVVALQNKRVILWNDDKVALFSRKVDNPVTDVWLEDITNDSELEVVIADRKGNILILSSAGYELRRLDLGKKLTVFGVLRFAKRSIFVTGDHSSELTFWDIDGNRIGAIELTGKPDALATGIPDDVSDMAYLVASTEDRRLGFWEIQESGKVSRSEKVILQEIESTKTIVYKRAIKCGNCGSPALPELKKCGSCGAVLEVLGEYEIEEFIQESIDSITSKHSKIKLKELDRILRRTLPKPAAYNLRRTLQAMIEKDVIDGHIDGNMFVRTEERKPTVKMPDRDAVEKVPSVLLSLLKKEDHIDVSVLEKETGVDRKILRRTLLILLGDGLIQGTLSGNIFSPQKNMKPAHFAKTMEKELQHWIRRR
jgi:hypothetical protein